MRFASGGAGDRPPGDPGFAAGQRLRLERHAAVRPAPARSRNSGLRACRTRAGRKPCCRQPPAGGRTSPVRWRAGRRPGRARPGRPASSSRSRASGDVRGSTTPSRVRDRGAGAQPVGQSTGWCTRPTSSRASASIRSCSALVSSCRSTSRPGARSASPASSACSVTAGVSGGTPARSVPSSPSRTLRIIRRGADPRRRAAPAPRRAAAGPAAVSATWRRERSNSSTPSSRSSRWIDWLSGGWAMPEQLRGPPEVQFLGDDEEVPQVPGEIHGRGYAFDTSRAGYRTVGGRAANGSRTSSPPSG